MKNAYLAGRASGEGRRRRQASAIARELDGHHPLDDLPEAALDEEGGASWAWPWAWCSWWCVFSGPGRCGLWCCWLRGRRCRGEGEGEGKVKEGEPLTTAVVDDATTTPTLRTRKFIITGYYGATRRAVVAGTKGNDRSDAAAPRRRSIPTSHECSRLAALISEEPGMNQHDSRSKSFNRLLRLST